MKRTADLAPTTAASGTDATITRSPLSMTESAQDMLLNTEGSQHLDQVLDEAVNAGANLAEIETVVSTGGAPGEIDAPST